MKDVARLHAVPDTEASGGSSDRKKDYCIKGSYQGFYLHPYGTPGASSTLRRSILHTPLTAQGPTSRTFPVFPPYRMKKKAQKPFTANT
jgi:hypothetical protein